MSAFDVLIVGSGHAGAQVAIALRQSNFAGSIAIVSDEHHLPYERPPLSKAALDPDYDFECAALRPAAFWIEQRIELLLGRRVVAVDAEAHMVSVSHGQDIGYVRLIWATGGGARPLPGAPSNITGLHYLRDRSHAEALRSEAAHADRVVIVGGGYIGLEVAAALVTRGRDVTLVEASARLLSRMASEPVSRFFEAEHVRQGLKIRLNANVVALETEAGAVRGVRLGDGETLAADLILVGIGIVPAVDALAAAGAVLEAGGVLVDGRCRTSLPDIYAIGDCAAHANPFGDGRVLRLESVQNANDQAAVVAADIMGAGADYIAVPWFWSDQYDLKLQTIGLSLGFDEAIVRGDLTGRSFSVIYKRDGAVIALDCVNAPRDYIQGRALVTRAARPDSLAIADVSRPLKSFA